MREAGYTAHEIKAAGFYAKKLSAAMQEAFDVTDKELLQRARRKKHTDGTTALLVLAVGAVVLREPVRVAAAAASSARNLPSVGWRQALARTGGRALPALFCGSSSA